MKLTMPPIIYIWDEVINNGYTLQYNKKLWKEAEHRTKQNFLHQQRYKRLASPQSFASENQRMVWYVWYCVNSYKLLSSTTDRIRDSTRALGSWHSICSVTLNLCKLCTKCITYLKAWVSVFHGYVLT